MATQTPPPRPTDTDESSPARGGASSPPTASADPAAATASARIIKRYSNRKLYDTVESRYVTLRQIAELVRKGEDVRIIDNNSKEDLTSVTLTQILYEEERAQSRALPLTALKDLIHTSGERIMSTLREGPMGKLMGGKAGEGRVEGAAADPAGTPRASNAPSSPPATEAASHTASGAGASAVAADEAATGKDGAAGKSPGRLYGMIEQSRGSLQEWQHRVDERVRKVLEGLNPASQFEKLQAEVRRLSQRIEELEAKLGMGGKGEGGERAGERAESGTGAGTGKEGSKDGGTR